jgi:outer membrane protein OmpA-like peptidoglycan-associated protein
MASGSNFSKELTTLAALVLAFFAVEISAQQSDAPGSMDHPMVTRYEGSFIDGYQVKDFDEFVLPLGKAVWRGDVKAGEKDVTLEGRITRILYRGPKNRSTLEILRNYRSALEDAGFEALYTCDRDCGNNFSGILYGPMETRILNSKTSGSAFDMPQDLRYLSARLKTAERTVHVSLMVAFDNGFGTLSKQPVTLLQIIEGQSMDTGMVTVDAEAIAKGIDETGHIAIYGIQFDTDSAVIKSESSPVLQEIATLLNNRPDLGLLVVGHTDNQGTLEYNMSLSDQRADAVVRYLGEKHDIDNSRLQSAGVGFLAPIASNESPAGRARNRRVELVKK